MTLPTTGFLSMSDVIAELQLAPGTAMSLTDARIKQMVNTGQAAVSMSQLRGTTAVGSVWTTQTSGTTRSLLGVARSPSSSRIVAVGLFDTIITSTNGTSWSVGSTGNPSVTFFAVIWAGTQFVAVGTDSIVCTSPDGLTWTTRSIFTVNPQLFLYDIAWNGSILVVVGQDGRIVTSPDGITWTARTSNTTESLFGVAWSGSQFVAVGSNQAGNNAAIVASPDGITWTPRLSGTANALQGVGWVRSQFNGVTWAKSEFIAVGASGTILTSPDGVTWTQRTSGAGFTLYDVAWFQDGIVVVGGGTGAGTILTSPNGVTWTVRLPPAGGISQLRSVIWAGSSTLPSAGARFIAVGTGGAVETSL